MRTLDVKVWVIKTTESLCKSKYASLRTGIFPGPVFRNLQWLLNDTKVFSLVVCKLLITFSLQPELKSSLEGIGVAEIMVEISHNFSLCVQQQCFEMGTQNIVMVALILHLREEKV